MQLAWSAGGGGGFGVPARRPLMTPGEDLLPAVEVFRKHLSVKGALQPTQMLQAVQLAYPEHQPQHSAPV